MQFWYWWPQTRTYCLLIARVAQDSAVALAFRCLLPRQPILDPIGIAPAPPLLQSIVGQFEPSLVGNVMQRAYLYHDWEALCFAYGSARKSADGIERAHSCNLLCNGKTCVNLLATNSFACEVKMCQQQTKLDVSEPISIRISQDRTSTLSPWYALLLM